MLSSPQALACCRLDACERMSTHIPASQPLKNKISRACPIQNSTTLGAPPTPRASQAIPSPAPSGGADEFRLSPPRGLQTKKPRPGAPGTDTRSVQGPILAGGQFAIRRSDLAGIPSKNALTGDPPRGRPPYPKAVALQPPPRILSCA